MNAAATVLLAFLRPSLLRLFTPRDNLDSIIPSFKSMGITPFLKYTRQVFLSIAWHYSALSSSHLPASGCCYCGYFVHPSDFNLHSCCRRNKEIGMAKDYRLEKRKFVIGGIALTIVLIYLIRLFVLQITTDDYKKNADSNAFLNKIQYPSRGAI